MKRIALLLLVSASLAAPRAAASTRPRYGGTLRVETAARIASLDPSTAPSDSAALALREKLFFLIGDRLVRFGPHGDLLPQLSTSWRSSGDARSWTFSLRENVRFSDNTPLTADQVVAALSARHPDWRITAQGMTVRIALPRSEPDLPLRLSLAENSILRPGPDGVPLGTGPFRVAQFTPARIVLDANANGWRGRPFLDSVEILLGRPLREQWIDLELGRADLVEIAPSGVRRALESNVRLWSSQPDELVAIAFQNASPAAQNFALRQALASSVNRAALRDVLLQKQGQVAASLLPEWLSGYAFLFAPASLPARPAGASALPPFSLAYDSSDALLASFAGRIAVDARAVGLRLNLVPQAPGAVSPADARLVRARIASLDRRVAFARLVESLGVAASSKLPATDSPEALYAAEQALVSSDWVIPLVDLPEIYGLGKRVENWMPPAVSLAGGWNLQNVWKEPK